MIKSIQENPNLARLLTRLVIIAHETADPDIDRWARRLLRLHLDAPPQSAELPDEDWCESAGGTRMPIR
jgi:hypothetical protein